MSGGTENTLSAVLSSPQTSTLKFSQKLLVYLKIWNHIYYYIPKGLYMVLFSVASQRGNLVLALLRAKKKALEAPGESRMSDIR